MEHKKIVISCDSTIAMTKDDILSNNLHVIPLNTIVDGKEYHDTIDIDSLKLCELMRNGAKISTSTPSPVEIENYFDELFASTNADIIIHYTISSKLSSMFSLFTTVCNGKYGNKVKVVDSLSICKWMANQVLFAQKLANEGLDADEIIKTVKDTLSQTEDCVFLPESIEYLKRGGRIKPAIAALVNFIGVLPILTFKDGEVGKKGVTRTLTKAFTNALKEWLESIENIKENYSLLILWNDNASLEKVEKIKAIIKEYAPDMDVVLGNISLNVTAHAGPGTVALGILKKY